MRLDRRRLLALTSLGAGNLLASGRWPGVLAAGDPPSGAFHFLVLNDLHYLDDRSGSWFERVVAQIRALPERPELILIAGDLAENGTPAQLGPIRDIFRTLRLPVHVVVGNHDYRTQTDRATYDELFPGQLNFTFEHQGWQFLGLDTSDGVRYQNIEIGSTTIRWLEDQRSRLSRQRPTVVFTHFPLGPGVTYRPRNADVVLRTLRDHNLQAVFSGHFHGLTERTQGSTTLTTNRCCAISRSNHDGSRQKGFFLCRAQEGRIRRTFVEVPSV